MTEAQRETALLRRWPRPGDWTAPDVEKRVIAAVIAEPRKRDLATDLELEDFATPRYRWMLETLRNLKESGAECEAFDVAHAMAMQSMERNPTRALSEFEVLSWLGELLIEAPRYEDAFGPAALIVFMADLRQLRIFARRRRVRPV